ncbi:cytochrome P450 [Mycena epipterygia]|nr:cytochrome P450 [Mycena epipterygia]
MDSDVRTLALYGLAAAGSIYWLCSGQKHTVPAVAVSKGFIWSALPSVDFLLHATDVVRKGYYQHRNGVFRIPTLFLRWDYVVNGPQRVAELAAAPESVLSFHEGVGDVLQTEFTMGPEIEHNPYHVQAIRGSLTRNLGRCFPAVQDEIVHAFDDVLALQDKEWKLIPILPSLMQIVARTSNRLFVGLPLCRTQEYLDLNISYTISVFSRGQIIRLLPNFLKPILSPLFSSRKSSLRHALKFLGPVIDKRLADEREHGPEWADRPNDLLSWLIDLAEGEELTTPALALRILVVNMAAIHTSSMALTDVLYDLTTYPEHILPMREEAERVIAKEGWSKVALVSMHKIDSFIRESQRMTGSGPLAMARKVISKDGFTFSDGTTIPTGTYLNVVGSAVHYDPENYEHADAFDGFRYSRLREERAAGHDEGNTAFFNRQMVSTAQDHLVFGHGRHACPGRFFAATELKAMLAHLLINYDVKAETEGVRPPDNVFGLFRLPNPQGKIWIRKRA